MSLVEKIKVLCEKNDISIPSLETELGFGHGLIYTWNKSFPKVNTLLKVAERFGVTIDSLITDKTIVVNDEQGITPEIINILTDPKLKSYILLTKEAADKGLPPEVLKTLIDVYTKK